MNEASRQFRKVAIHVVALSTLFSYNNCTGFNPAASIDTNSNTGSSVGGGTPLAIPTPFPKLGDYPIIPSNFDTKQFVATGWGPTPDEGASDPVGAFRMVCNASHEGYDDPIVYPGKPGASHLHQFYGNTLTDAFSTYESLRTTGQSTCNGPLNRSAYWVPAVMNGKGKVVRPDFVTVYYKRYPKDSPLCSQQGKECVNLPRGLRMVFGFNFNTKALDKGAAIIYRCKGPDKPDVIFPDLTSAAKDRGPGHTIDLSISGPSCWNGVDLDSPDHRSHVVYGSYVWNGSTSEYKCPDTHPYIIPTISISPEYSVDADLDQSGIYTAGVTKTWYLSSDGMGATKKPGETFHADWFGAWDDDTLKTWEDNCIDKHLSCAGGDLGNGQHMTYFDGFTLVASPHIVDPPPMPMMPSMSH